MFLSWLEINSKQTGDQTKSWHGINPPIHMQFTSFFQWLLYLQFFGDAAFTIVGSNLKYLY